MVETPVQKTQDKFLDDLLDSIQPNADDVIERRIHHIGFAKVITWICLTARKKYVFKRKEFKTFIGLTSSRTHEILSDLCEAGMLKKKSNPSNQGYDYVIVVVDGGKPKINKYFEKALKTLGKKPKRKISYEIDADEESYL